MIALDKPLRKYEDLVPFETYNGHSVGQWEGDALVIETNGFNEDTFLDSTGLPATAPPSGQTAAPSGNAADFSSI